MKLRHISIENCKSYREAEKIQLDPNFNVFVGPNGGGKSNTLDIINIVLRRFFLYEYRSANEEQNGAFYRNIQQAIPFSDTPRFLEPNLDKKDAQIKISLTLEVGQSDVENVRLIRDNNLALKEAAKRFRSVPNPHLIDQLSKTNLVEGALLSYEVSSYALGWKTEEARIFQEYCSAMNLMLLLASEIRLQGLKPLLAYFSPYRQAAGSDLRANLSGEDFRANLSAYANSSSHMATSLIKLATLYFAELRRELESSASESGYLPRWSADPVVKNVTRYLNKLGYEWDLVARDAKRNIYEIWLTRDGRSVAIEQASSGEKEILTFVLGIFALQTAGGLVIIDEPEVHLHPRWQSVLRDLLQELAGDTDNQLVISTHSPVFITPKTINNVRRVFRDKSHTTRVVKNSEKGHGKLEEKDHWHTLNSHNNERVFFADRVVLVEGIQDRIIFEALISRERTDGSTEITEVVEVHGKNNFRTYGDLLEGLGVPFSTIADLDYLEQLASDAAKHLFYVDFSGIDKKVLRNKRSDDRQTLSEQIEDALGKNDTGALKATWEYIKGRHRKLRTDLSSAEIEQFEELIGQYRSHFVFLLSRGQIEDYLPIYARSIAGTIELTKTPVIDEWLSVTAKTEETRELLAIARAVACR